MLCHVVSGMNLASSFLRLICYKQSNLNFIQNRLCWITAKARALEVQNSIIFHSKFNKEWFDGPTAGTARPHISCEPVVPTSVDWFAL